MYPLAAHTSNVTMAGSSPGCLRDEHATHSCYVTGEGEDELTLPPRCNRTRASKDSKMSMEGWWMVTMTVRPLRDTFLMLCMTMAAARASSPAAIRAQESACVDSAELRLAKKYPPGWLQKLRLQSDNRVQATLLSHVCKSTLATLQSSAP